MTSVPDEKERQAIRFLAGMQELVNSIARTLEADVNATEDSGSPAATFVDTTTRVECRQYEFVWRSDYPNNEGVVIEMWLEAELRSGDAITCWMDALLLQQGWLLSGSVSRTSHGESQHAKQETLFELPERVVADFQTVQTEAPEMFTRLVASARSTLASSHEQSI